MSFGHCDLHKWGNPICSILLDPEYLYSLLRSIVCRLNQCALLRCEHPSAPI